MTERRHPQMWLNFAPFGMGNDGVSEEGTRMEVQLPDGQRVWGTLRKKEDGRLFLEPDHEITLGSFVERDGTVYDATVG